MDPITGVRLIEVGGAIYRSYAAPSGGATSGQQQRGGTPQQQQREQQPPRPAAAPGKRTAPAAAATESPAALAAVAPGSAGAFSDRVPLDAPIIPFLIGRQGARRREIEGETGASLDIPRAPPATGAGAASGGAGECVVTIRAPTQAALAAARARVAGAFDSAVNARWLDYDAFVALPLTGSNAATAALAEWGARVRAHPDAAKWGLTDESVFVDPPLLHLTLVMLKLYSAPRRAAAAAALEAAAAAARAALGGGGPLRVRLRGLANMKGGDAAMHVAYAKVEEVGSSGRLEAVCAAAVKAFKDAGLLIKGERETVKIHATVINTRKRSSSTDQQQQQDSAGSGGGGGGGARGGWGKQQQEQRVPFDGRELLQGGELELDLGEVDISEVAVVRRGTRGPDGFYQRLSTQAL